MKKKMRYINILVLLGFVLLKPCVCVSQNVYTDFSNNNKLESARTAVLHERFGNAVQEYASLVKKDDNKIVSAEYAFALALYGCYDGSIMNLDKILTSSKANKETLFYISQVLKLMEYDKVANVFWTTEVSDPPVWLSGKYKVLVEKYKKAATINADNLSVALQRANMLVAQQQYIQSIVLYEELMETYPNEYLPYIGASALWESLGYKTMAADYLQKGLNAMGKDKAKYDSDGIYQKHLSNLKEDNKKEYMAFRPQKLKYIGNKPSKNLAYLGLSYMNKTLALNARYGYRTSNNTNMSVDVGFTKFDGSKMFTTDLSFNGTLNRINVVGVGLSAQFSGGEFDGGAGLRAGWSLPLSNGKSSVDIMLSDYYMIKNKNFRVTLSIGYTCYF